MNKKVTTNIVKETEKAYQLNVLYWTLFDKPEKTATMWVPKSCCDIEDGKVKQDENGHFYVEWLDEEK